MFRRERLSRFGRALAFAAIFVSAAGPLCAGTSTLQNPVWTFPTPGPVQVTLKACNNFGCNTKVVTIQVLDPRPAIVSAALSTNVATVGALVHLQGAATGQPQLSVLWLVQDTTGATVTQVAGADTWLDTSVLPAGQYTIVLQASNSLGTAASLPLALTLTSSQADLFYTVTPCRLFDSRSFGAPLLSTDPPQAIGIFQLSACGVPATARALALNVTVTNPTGSGFVNAWASDQPLPGTSIVSFVGGQTRAAAAIVGLSSGVFPQMSLQAFVSGNGGTDVVVDVNGYFQPAAATLAPAKP